MDTHQNLSTYINEELLFKYGENCSRHHKVNGKCSLKPLRQMLISSTKNLESAADNLSKMLDSSETNNMQNWLFDNHWLVKRESIDLISAFNSSCKIPSCDGLPSIFHLCRCLVKSGNGLLTKERCRIFLYGWQNYQILEGRELRLFVSCMKLSIIYELDLLYKKYISLNTDSAEMVSALFSSLKFLSSFNFKDILENANKAEQILLSDPSGIYPVMSHKTKSKYLEQLEKLSRINSVSEFKIAEKAISLAKNSTGEKQHVGYWLFTCPLGKKARRSNPALYIFIFFLLTVTFSCFLGFYFGSFFTALLSILPISEIIKSIMDLILIKLFPPSHIPRLELKNGVPYEGRTLLVIPSIINSIDKIDILARQLEEFCCASKVEGKNLLFGILADFTDSNTAHTKDDVAFTKHAQDAINSLNKKYGGGFYYFTRDRVYNKRDKIYMGWERKRGAITELIRLIHGGTGNIKCLSGSSLSLSGVKYLITLDEDTKLIPGTAGELIGAMLHPLNKAVIDGKNNIVKSGYGIIHPHISTELSSCNKNRFTSIFAEHGGADPYGSDTSELYMDVFECGSFAGKGIIDIEAFEKCVDHRFPENHVLSHDALEGAYLRGGFMGDAELLDSFPENLLSYYKRLHRWTRGDWQNSPWIFKKGKNLPLMYKFKLFDNLRRSLFPISYILSFICAFFLNCKGISSCAIISFFAINFGIFSYSLQSLFRRNRESTRRCISKCIRGVDKSLILSLFSVLFLPFESYVILSAVFKSLWRMLVSKTHLLDWTPASVSDGMENNLCKYYFTMFPCIILGIIALFSPSIIGKSLGLLWLISPIFAFDLTKPALRSQILSADDKAYLIRKCKSIWNYFKDFCTAEDNFLPPDNFQDQPPLGLAHRTSPTNIGLCLLSCITAIDLQIESKDYVLSLIASILSTLKRMPKYLGHLYNWYNTRTLKPLHPAYISTVDSGNFAVCLMILKEALSELNEDVLVRYCNELLDPMSFQPLYDKNHGLFSTSLSSETGKLSDSFYDLMASEARTASFVAIAKGDIPKKHWRSLSRAMVDYKGFRGMISWTGTMFEYMMPRLFFKSERGSLLYESMNLCCYVQKKRCPKNIPWGISESACHSLNKDLSYSYKAHGCSSLALKRNVDKELIISPYSSFLALPFYPKAAIENMRKLEKHGAGCHYGFYEALDYSKNKNIFCKGEVVRCVMAHHLGMSLISAGNLICEDIMCKRLMKDPNISAYSCLLDEKLSFTGTVYRKCRESIPVKSMPKQTIYWEKSGDDLNLTEPVSGWIGNENYHIYLNQLGSCTAEYKGNLIYKSDSIPPFLNRGLNFLISENGRVSSFFISSKDINIGSCHWKLSFYGGSYDISKSDLRFQMNVSCSKEDCGERRIFYVSHYKGISENLQLICSFKPFLCPAGYGLDNGNFKNSILKAYIKNGSIILGRTYEDDCAGTYMCIAFSEPAKFYYHSGSLENLSLEALNAIDEEISLHSSMVLASVPIHAGSGIDSSISMAIGVAESKIGAYHSAIKILSSDIDDISSFPSEMAAKHGLSEKETQYAMEIYRHLNVNKDNSEYIKSKLSQDLLDDLGISGLIPIYAWEISGKDIIKNAASLIRQHKFLCSIFSPFDLVLVTSEGTAKLSPVFPALETLKKELSADDTHIFMLDRSRGGCDFLSFFGFPTNFTE